MKLKIAVAVALAVFTVAVSGILVANWLSPAQPQTPNEGSTESLTMAEVSVHNTRQDCWIIVSNSVYNVTEFISAHPGGADILAAQCGKDATAAFQSQGGQGSHSDAARSRLASLKIGDLQEGGNTPAAETPANTQPSSEALPQAIKEKYPNASLVETNHEEEEQRYEISTNGQCREIRMANNAIIRDKDC